MKILLIRPNFGSYYQITPPLSLGYLSSSLKQNGYTDIGFIDASLGKLNSDEVINRLSRGDYPDLIGIQVYTGSQNWTKEFISDYRKVNKKAKIVVGGPHISGLKEYALDYIGADYGIIGEGENSIVGLAKLLEGKIKEHDIEGLVYRKNGKWKNAEIPYGFLKNADKIPFPDWELLKPQNYFKYMEAVSMPLCGKRPVPILTSRGCPYQCTFCCSGITNKRIMRYRSPENVVAEIQFLKAKYRVDEIFFSDDNLTMDIERAKKIFSLMIEQKLNIHWRAPNGIRIDRIDEKLAEKMAQSGGYYVGVGVESGSAEVIKRIKKNINLKTVKEKVDLLHKYKIKVSGFFMTGLLNETISEANETVEFTLSVPFDRIQVCNFVPYPGSEDFNEIFKSSSKKEFKKRIYEFQKSGTIPNFESLELKKNYRFQKKMMFSFYLRPKIIFQMIKGIRISQIIALFRHPFLKKWTIHKKSWYDN